MKKIYWYQWLLGVLLILFLLGVWIYYSYFIVAQRGSISYKDFPPPSIETGSQPLPSSMIQPTLHLIATGMKVPRAMVSTHANRVLVTERVGYIRQIVNEKLFPKPLITINNISQQSEEGVMGIALDPGYKGNFFVYVSYAYMSGKNMYVKVVRFVDKIDYMTGETTIIDHLPAAKFHAGSFVGFGPDGKLYISVGDGLKKDFAQRDDKLNGKILRINPDGTIPEDNPIKNSPIRAKGLRNTQALIRDEQGKIFAVDHGPTIFDGPPGGDEINLIEKGKNYGWPIVSHNNQQSGFAPSMLVFKETIAPSGLIKYSGRMFPQWAGSLLVAGLKGEGIFAVKYRTENPYEILQLEKFPFINLGRIRAIIEGPEGEIYFATSNTDGRGTPSANDDAIYKITR